MVVPANGNSWQYRMKDLQAPLTDAQPVLYMVR